MVADVEKTFRLQGIPRSHDTAEKVQILIQSCLGEGLEDDIFIRSISPDAHRPDELVATLNFCKIPPRLKRSDAVVFDIPGSPANQLAVDAHFEGFTPLHTNDNESCAVDVVALSGLNGHPFGSFKAKGSYRMWLRDVLAPDLPNARVFIYGYKQQDAFHHIYDLSNSFCARLRTIRGNSASPRPLILIGHSLGGLVIKSAIILLGQSRNETDALSFRSLLGVLFFGVPSFGMNIGSLVPMVHESVRRSLLYTLDEANSAVLHDLNRGFVRIVACLSVFKVYNFYETRESPTARQRGDGSWAMDGPLTILVKPTSATQGSVGENTFACHKTHSELVKFSGKHDVDYSTTFTCIQDLMQLGAIQQQPAARPKEQEGKFSLEQVTAAGVSLTQILSDFLRSLYFLEHDFRERSSAIEAAKGTCNWLLQNESFQSWSRRNNQLLCVLGPPGAGKSTLMKYAVQRHREQMHEELIATFFVNGRGNSLEMSPLGFYRSILYQVLPHFPDKLAELTVRYDSGPQNEQDSLTGTMATKLAGLMGSTLGSALGNGLGLNEPRRPRWKWTEDDLRQDFLTILSGPSCQSSLTLFVDALDEMGQTSAEKVITDIATVSSRARRGGLDVKVAFSCRYYPILVDEDDEECAVVYNDRGQYVDHGPCIKMERANRDGIRSLVYGHHFHGLDAQDEQAIKDVIIDRANGIFQWSAIVLREVSRMRRERRPVVAVRKMVETIPLELRSLYKSLLSTTSSERRRSLKFFQWIMFSARPLSVAEFRVALSVDAEMTHRCIRELEHDVHYAYSLNDMTTLVRALSKGLAEVKYSRDSSTSGRVSDFDNSQKRVELIHQSVSDYLMEGGLEELEGAILGSGIIRAHFQLSRSCIKYLLLEEIQQHLEIPSRHRKPFLPDSNDDHESHALRIYARRYWIFHAEKVEDGPGGHWRNLSEKRLVHGTSYEAPARILQKDLVDLFSWSDGSNLLPIKFERYPETAESASFWRNGHRGLFETEHRRAFTGRGTKSHPNMVVLFTHSGLLSTLQEMENRHPNLFVGQQAWKLLPYALLGKHERVFQHLVPRLEDADAALELCSRGDDALPSPLLLAVAMGDEDLVRRFARIPQFLDHAFEDAWGQRMPPLCLAVTKENAGAMVRCLVDAGADMFQDCRVRPDDEWLKLDTTAIGVAAALGNVDALVAFFQKSLECGQAERLLLDTGDGKGRRPWEKCADQRTLDVFKNFAGYLKSLSEISEPLVRVLN